MHNITKHKALTSANIWHCGCIVFNASCVSSSLARFSLFLRSVVRSYAHLFVLPFSCFLPALPLLLPLLFHSYYFASIHTVVFNMYMNEWNDVDTLKYVCYFTFLVLKAFFLCACLLMHKKALKCPYGSYFFYLYKWPFLCYEQKKKKFRPNVVCK